MYSHCVTEVLCPRMSTQHLERGLRLFTAPFTFEPSLGFPIMMVRVDCFWWSHVKSFSEPFSVLWPSLEFILREELGPQGRYVEWSTL